MGRSKLLKKIQNLLLFVVVFLGIIVFCYLIYIIFVFPYASRYFINAVEKLESSSEPQSQSYTDTNSSVIAKESLQPNQTNDIQCCSAEDDINIKEDYPKQQISSSASVSSNPISSEITASERGSFDDYLGAYTF